MNALSPASAPERDGRGRNFLGIGVASWRWALILFLAACLLYTLWSLTVLTFLPRVVQNVTFYGHPVVTAFDLYTGARFAYSREVDGRPLTFRQAGPGRMRDVETGSLWSLDDGCALTGSYAGECLAEAAFRVEEIFPYHGVSPYPVPLLGIWQRFDANWYLSIALHGYGHVEGDVHFPPLYPLLIRALTCLGLPPFPSALLLSNLALVPALALFYDLTVTRYGHPTARRATVYLMLFPTAFFFFSAYTESLFLLAALLSLWMMERRRWLWAGFWTFCAILLRLQGVALLLPLTYALWATRPVRRWTPRLVALSLPLAASLLYLTLRVLCGDPNIVPLSEPDLYARLAPPWENYLYALRILFSGRAHFVDLLNLVLTTLFVALLVVGWRRLPRLFGLYAAASLIVLTVRLVETQPLNSMTRYTLTVFPVFVLLGIWGENPWVQRAVVYPSMALALFLSAQFWLWGWVG